MGSIRVLCIGNYFASDDGLGIHVYRRLQGRGLPGCVDVRELGMPGLALLDEMEGARAVILVDALHSGEEPGTLRRLDSSLFVASERSPLAAHDLGIADVLAVAREVLGPRMPQRVVLIGVEGAVFDRFGTALSPPVQEAVDRVVRRVEEEIGEEMARVVGGVP